MYIQSNPKRTIPKRAAVALVLVESGGGSSILYIRRPGYKSDRWAGHLAFPGGKVEGKEEDLEAAMRETREEIGWDLANKSLFDYIGQLDDRDVKAPNSSSTVMVLTAFVFAFKGDASNMPLFNLEAGEVYSIYLVPISYLASRTTLWQPVSFPLSRYLIPSFIMARFPLIDSILQTVLQLGTFDFYGIPFPDSFKVLPNPPKSKDLQASPNSKIVPKPEKMFPLWGLTLWMTSDFISIISSPTPNKPNSLPNLHLLPPSLHLDTTTLDIDVADIHPPRFSSPDLDFLLTMCHWIPSSGKHRSLKRFLERGRLVMGLRTHIVVPGVVVAGIVTRLVCLYAAFKAFSLMVASS